MWKIQITLNVTLFIQYRSKQKITGLFNRFPSFICDAVYGSSQEMITDRTVMAPMLDLAVKSQNRTAQTVSTDLCIDCWASLEKISGVQNTH